LYPSPPTVTMHSTVLILALATVSTALEFTDRVVERSPTHEMVALAPVDLASLPAWDQEGFERSHPELRSTSQPSRAADDQSFAPGQLLFGNGGFFMHDSFMGQRSQMMAAPLFQMQQPVMMMQPMVQQMQQPIPQSGVFRYEGRMGDSQFKWSSIQDDGSNRHISVIQ
ncbi:hypothetical protein PFISCL1PPCAC_15932, partial [Pristionchus fissidentatus]